MPTAIIHTEATAPDRPAPGADGRALLTISFGVAVGYVAALMSMAADHSWIIDGRGRPLLTDFIAVWSAGRQALQGAALSTYDGSLQHLAEAAALGHSFHGYLGWPYPPSFLFAAMALASLPYAWAFAAWVVGGSVLSGASVAAITGRPAAAVVAAASPWAFACVIVGQNGLLTAALIGFVLLTLEKRPVLSGVLLGLLTYKPHFGLLFPLALAAGGYWRAFLWAAVSVLGLAALSAAAFGLGAWMAFFHDLPLTTQTLVANGGVGWMKLQSVYGLARILGGSNAAGWTAQAVLTASCVVAVFAVWRRAAPMALKAAVLAVAAVLATPYVFSYDLPILTVAAAFLYRHRPFDRWEYLAVAAAALMVIPVLSNTAPFGLFASLAIAVAVGRRLVVASVPAAASLQVTLAGA